MCQFVTANHINKLQRSTQDTATGKLKTSRFQQAAPPTKTFKALIVGWGLEQYGPKNIQHHLCSGAAFWIIYLLVITSAMKVLHICNYREN